MIIASGAQQCRLEQFSRYVKIVDRIFIVWFSLVREFKKIEQKEKREGGMKNTIPEISYYCSPYREFGMSTVVLCVRCMQPYCIGNYVLVQKCPSEHIMVTGELFTCPNCGFEKLHSVIFFNDTEEVQAFVEKVSKEKIDCYFAPVQNFILMDEWMH